MYKCIIIEWMIKYNGYGRLKYGLAIKYWRDTSLHKLYLILLITITNGYLFILIYYFIVATNCVTSLVNRKLTQSSCLFSFRSCTWHVPYEMIVTCSYYFYSGGAIYISSIMEEAMMSIVYALPLFALLFVNIFL